MLSRPLRGRESTKINVVYYKSMRVAGTPDKDRFKVDISPYFRLYWYPRLEYLEAPELNMNQFHVALQSHRIAKTEGNRS